MNAGKVFMYGGLRRLLDKSLHAEKYPGQVPCMLERFPDMSMHVGKDFGQV